MIKPYKYKCEECGWEWESNDYPHHPGDTESVKYVESREGYKCPECGSRNISGELINY